MSDAKHTPGPWIVEGKLVGTADPTGIKPGVFDSVGCVHEMDYDTDRANADENGFYVGEQTAANALLFAAAPDMLAALSDWQELRDSDGDDGRDAVEWIERVERQMRAAIAKATGK